MRCMTRMAVALTWLAVVSTGPVVMAQPVQSTARWIIMQGTNRRSIPDHILSQVDGIMLRVTFKHAETPEGKALIQAELNRCANMGKTVMLAVMGGIHSPDRLITTGDTAYGVWNSGSGFFPVPWREDYQDAYTALMGEIAVLPNAHVISHVHMPSAHSMEMHYRQSNIYSTYADADLQLEQAYVAMGQDLGLLFPGAVVLASLGDTRPWVGAVISELQAQMGPSFGIQMHALSARTNTNWINFTQIQSFAGPKGFQMLSGSNQNRFGGTFSQAITKGESASAEWYQIYRPDVDEISP